MATKELRLTLEDVDVNVKTDIDGDGDMDRQDEKVILDLANTFFRFK
ncbi:MULTISPECIES: hypothetical protein [unclassified Pseudomonas]|nr:MULTISPECIES: hypothetical protein [unclassified Pseudomonas]MDR8388709.1 hypothetical protein [Pseudomonas sp. JL2]WNZ77146.1 hypothetical protein QOM08_20885 [Pseudomonas sp. P105]VII90039.1 hypothetical protein [Pseudomonas sp. FG-3G]